MNKRVRIRLIGLLLGVGIMGAAIVVMLIKSERHTDKLRTRLIKLDSESFRIADEFANFLTQLNNPLYDYGTTHDQEEINDFEKAGSDLNKWIDAQKPKLTSERERNLMQQIDSGYDDYLRAAEKLRAKLQKSSPKTVTIGEYSELMKESQHLFNLGNELAKAHFQSRGILIAGAQQNISELRLLVFVCLGSLLFFGLAIATVVHRDMIAPLRVKLVEGEALLERREKLAALGMLSAGVAHEIRNPLTAIKTAVFIQQKQFKPGSQEHTDSKVIEREILRLEKIVNDFLLFARPVDPKCSPVAAETLLAEVQALLGPQLTKSGVTLQLEKAPAMWVNVDAAQIKQVLINLVQNAADAVGSKGAVKLRARSDQKWLENKRTPVVILEVVDDGKGIAPDVQERLFDPFFTTKDNGTGLGLSIAAGIVHKHGGTLQYQTQVNHGTTFGVILPRNGHE